MEWEFKRERVESGTRDGREEEFPRRDRGGGRQRQNDTPVADTAVVRSAILNESAVNMITGTLTPWK